jgi:hypothetical protein
MRFVWANLRVFFATPMLATTCRELVVDAMAAATVRLFWAAFSAKAGAGKDGLARLLFLDWRAIMWTGT